MTEPFDALRPGFAGPAAVRGGGVRVVGYVLGVAITTASAAVLFRQLGVNDGGHYVTVLALVSVCAGATELGLSAIGVRETAVRDDRSRGVFLAELLTLRLLLSTAGACVAIALAWVAYGGRIAEATAVTAVATTVQAATSTWSIQLQVTLRFGWVTVIELTRQALVAALVVLVAALGGGLVALLAVQIPASVVSLALAARLVEPDVGLRLRIAWRPWAALLRETLPFALATAVGVLYLRMIVLVTGAVTTTHETGLFAAAFRIVDVLMVIPALVAGSAFPVLARAARDDHARLSHALQPLWDTCVLLGTATAVALVPAAPFVLAVVAGRAFDGGAPALRWAALALVASFASAATSYTLLTLRAHAALLKANVVALVTAVAASAFLASSHGAAGAGGATLVTEVVLATGNFIALRRRAPHLHIALGRTARTVAAGAIAIALPLALSLPTLVGSAVSVAVFAGLVVVVRAWPPELLASLPSRATSHHTIP